MKLSTKARYGLRAVYFLAQNYGTAVALSKIAEETGLTQPYLEKLLNLLKKGKIVKTLRGVSGGYALSISPEKISAGQVLRALENGLVITDCNTTCSTKCPNRFVFTRLYKEINKTLDNISIQDIIQENEEENI